MKYIVLVISLCTSFLLSCNDAGNSASNQAKNDSVDTQKQSVSTDTSTNIKKDSAHVAKDSSNKQQSNSELAKKIPGNWAQVGMQNATFVIEKKKITYPETFKSYNYSLIDDSIKIKYDDYTGSYAVKLKGPDTLVLTGDEENVYYRFKKK